MKKRILNLLIVRAVRRYLGAQGPNWATIVAWNLFFAFLPMVILTITVVGLVMRDPGTRATIEQQVVAAFPDCRSGGTCEILSALRSFRQSTGLFAIIGILGLVWTGASLFSAMEQGLNSLYPVPSRGFVRQKLMAIGMVVLFTLMAVPLIASGSLLSLLQSLPGVPSFLHGGPAGLLLQLGAGIVDASLLFGVIYYVVPHRPQRVRDVIPGALVTGILFEVVTLAFPLYFKAVTHSPQWGQTFGLIFVLLFYFFLIGQMIMLGGAVNAEVSVGHEHPATGLPAGAPESREVRTDPGARAAAGP
ncbi:MAG: YihY/virulence factor BrkB family protein [Candidatus Dormibacteraeota bacterium]|nr:YihY/virulence factor BrkB family protein [Candidatus Dormibacteraeota bacterium]